MMFSLSRLYEGRNAFGVRLGESGKWKVRPLARAIIVYRGLPKPLARYIRLLVVISRQSESGCMKSVNPMADDFFHLDAALPRLELSTA